MQLDRMSRVLSGGMGVIGSLAAFWLLSSYSPGLGCVVAALIAAASCAAGWYYGPAMRWKQAHGKALAMLQQHCMVEARLHARRAMQHARQMRGPKREEAYQASLGLAAYNVPASDRAATIAELREALALPDPGTLARILATSRLASLLADDGRHEEAMVFAAEAERLAELSQNGAMKIGAATLLAEIAAGRGALGEAAAHYQQVFEAISASDDPVLKQDFSAHRVNVGNVYLTAGQPARALTEFQAALALLDAGGRSGTYATSTPLLNASAALLDLNQPAEALDCVERGLRVLATCLPPDDQQLASFWIAKTFALAQGGQGEEARRAFEHARQWELSSEPELLEAMTTARGDVMMVEGNYDGAEQAYQEALRAVTARKGEHHPVRMEGLVRLEKLYVQMNRPDAAERCRAEHDSLLDRVRDV
jgi:tetratricopeptide (TPR) repeat protein